MASFDGELLSNGDIPSELVSRTRMLEKFVSTPGSYLHADALLVSTSYVYYVAGGIQVYYVAGGIQVYSVAGGIQVYSVTGGI